MYIAYNEVGSIYKSMNFFLTPYILDNIDSICICKRKAKVQVSSWSLDNNN